MLNRRWNMFLLSFLMLLLVVFVAVAVTLSNLTPLDEALIARRIAKLNQREASLTAQAVSNLKRMEALSARSKARLSRERADKLLAKTQAAYLVSGSPSLLQTVSELKELVKHQESLRLNLELAAEAALAAAAYEALKAKGRD